MRRRAVRFFSMQINHAPVAFLVLFAVPLCSSAHFPVILWLLGWTVRTEQGYVRHETIIQQHKPGPDIRC